MDNFQVKSIKIIQTEVLVAFNKEFYKVSGTENFFFLYRLFQRIDKANKKTWLFFNASIIWYQNWQGHYEKRKLQASLTKTTEVKVLD